jgi:trimethylamine--corrinoid protein Co-methyltransferase
MKRRFKTGISRNSGLSLNILTDDECHEIHLSTLELLKDTGIYCESEEALAYFDGGGCKVDHKQNVVKFPNWVVEDAIRVTPSTFYCCGRRPEDDVILEDKRVTFTNFGEAIRFVDPYSGEHRDTTKADLIKTTRVIDYLGNIDTCERAMVSGDKPPGVQAIHNADAMLNNTTKHLWLGPVNRYQAQKVIEMCGVVVGGKEKLKDRPLVTFGTCPISPLKLPEDHTDVIIEAAQNGIGVFCVGMALSGGSSPIHLAGTLVLQNVEILSSLVLSQLVAKGSKFVYGSSTCPIDMRTANATVGSPETGVISAAVARLARYYSLPCFVAGG